jgi:hypothetical protein
VPPSHSQAGAARCVEPGGGHRSVRDLTVGALSPSVTFPPGCMTSGSGPTTSRRGANLGADPGGSSYCASVFKGFLRNDFQKIL